MGLRNKKLVKNKSAHSARRSARTNKSNELRMQTVREDDFSRFKKLMKKTLNDTKSEDLGSCYNFTYITSDRNKLDDNVYNQSSDAPITGKSTQKMIENYNIDMLKGGKVAIIEKSSLTSADLECLKPSSWLDDNVIEFVLEYQKNFIFDANRHEIAVLSPAVVQMVKLAKTLGIEEIRLQITPLDLMDKSIVLIPVNNSQSEGDGSHWSLLIFLPQQFHFHHIDTLGDANKISASNVANNLLELLKQDLSCFGVGHRSSDTQQNNGHDCGLHVLQYARAAMLHFCKNKMTMKEFHPKIETKNSNAKRKEILQRIEHVADKRNSKISRVCRYIGKNGSSYDGNDIDFHNEL